MERHELDPQKVGIAAATRLRIGSALELVQHYALGGEASEKSKGLSDTATCHGLVAAVQLGSSLLEQCDPQLPSCS